MELLNNQEYLIEIKNYDDRYMELSEDIIDFFPKNFERIKKYFNISIEDQIKIIIYTNLEDYHHDNPECTVYSRGCFAKNMVSKVVTEYSLKGSSNMSIIASILHEVVHTIYYTYFEHANMSNRVVWFDEGLAQNLSGEKGKLNNDHAFKRWFYKNINNFSHIKPDMNNLLKHGSSFVPEDGRYNGYNISFFMVHYLMDVLSEDEFKNLFARHDYLINNMDAFYEEAKSYYQKKYPVKDNIRDVLTPEELYDYMDNYFSFGYVDKMDNIHYKTLKEFKENYVTKDINDLIKFGYGNCLDQSRVIKSVLSNLGYEVYLYGLYNKDEDELHFTILYQRDKVWYNFEHVLRGHEGIKKYDSREDAINGILTDFDYPSSDVFLVDDIPLNLNYEEILDYLGLKKRTL